MLQDHATAMTVFRRYLETCSPSLGTVPEILPFYALPYVPDPNLHPAFRNVFQVNFIVYFIFLIH